VTELLARPTPRWGLPDALWCWLAGLVAVQLAAIVGQAFGVDPYSTGTEFALFVPAQAAGTIGCALFVSKQRGVGTLRRDFGFTLRPRDWPALLIGLSLQICALVLLTPITQLAHLHHEPQRLVEQAKDVTSPVLLVVIVFATVMAAPAVEELVFRGLLLRALLRRTTEGWSIGISALAFAAVHVLFDPGAGYVFPGLFGLGIVLAVVAMRDRSLSRPILIHAGFNVVAVALTLMHA